MNFKGSPGWVQGVYVMSEYITVEILIGGQIRELLLNIGCIDHQVCAAPFYGMEGDVFQQALYHGMQPPGTDIFGGFIESARRSLPDGRCRRGQTGVLPLR